MSSGFFSELRRRKVYRVAAAYVVAAGFIIQIGSATFPAWELPGWALRLVIMLVLSGFPIALILAWAFDVTASGIERAPATEVPREGTGFVRRRRNLFVLVALGVIVSVAAGFFVLPRLSARKLDKSIAVLPFDNFSDDKENAFFADGIQDDILTNLSKIGDLKVISRTSVMPYRGRGHNVRDIGKALGVTAILEGSVRRSGNRVKVNVQLINATNDQHIWAQDYDGELTDVFALQSDLARKIAKALQAQLSPAEQALVERQPTQSGEAYLLYSQGRDMENRPDRLPEALAKAEELYQRAIELDPAFALAHSRLSRINSWRYHSDEPLPPRAEKARAAALDALRLQPDLPESHLALGFCYYYIDGDYEKALSEFAIAKRDLPNDSETYLAIGAIERRQGKWKASTANLEKAASVNPKNLWVLEQLAVNYVATRDFARALAIYDRALEIEPQSLSVRSMKVKIAMEWKGDFGPAEQLLANLASRPNPPPIIAVGRINVHIQQRKYREALQILEQAPPTSFKPDASHSKAFFEGVIYTLLGDEARARPAFEQARTIAEERIRESPRDAPRHAHLGLILACLKEKESAIAEGKQAVELLPESKDALDGPEMTKVLAQIYALTGEKEEAFRLIEHLLVVPNGLTIYILQQDPIWDILRSDPKFDELIKRHGRTS